MGPVDASRPRLRTVTETYASRALAQRRFERWVARIALFMLERFDAVAALDIVADYGEQRATSLVRRALDYADELRRV